ncbi:MAG: pyridoxamine 5'-phosphate oxidase family protein [Candidatus Eremiobacteraeota bacterium]|nr:pyridoxamine 5'-phosphate oxidase family protein [Candidatus Eremiobacteraeota bacterium]
MAERSRQRGLTALGRHPERGHDDFETIAAILDAGLVCHVGVLASEQEQARRNDRQPVVIPTIYGRIDRDLFLHGSAVARWMNDASKVARICVTVTIVDGLVLARSAFNHSMNYRSVVMFGEAVRVENQEQKLRALEAVTEHVCPGRWNDARKPTEQELKTTLVLRVPIVEASAKIRSGPPKDFDFDMGAGIWAGVIPITTVRGEAIPDPALDAGIATPAYATMRAFG